MQCAAVCAALRTQFLELRLLRSVDSAVAEVELLSLRLPIAHQGLSERGAANGQIGLHAAGGALLEINGEIEPQVIDIAGEQQLDLGSIMTILRPSPCHQGRPLAG